MKRVIGLADEFWRLRMTRVDTTDDLDFEWHEDILYRQPNVRQAGDVELWHVEAVRLDDLDTIVRIRTFDGREEAEAFYEKAAEDLGEMTKSQFEEAYLEPCAEASQEDAEEL